MGSVQIIYKLRHHLQCIICPKFHTSEANGSEKEDLYITMVQIKDTLGRIHIGPWDKYLNKLGLGPQNKVAY